MRQKLVLSTTTAPASTIRGAHSELTDPPAEESTRSSPCDRLVGDRPDLELAARERHPLAGRALGGERDDL